MGKPNVSKFFNSVKTSVSRHSPEILTGMGIAGMITSTILAVKATPKALQIIEEEKKAAGIDDCTTEKLKPTVIVKSCWKIYAPAAVTCVVSAACLIGASRVNLRRNAALATAYKLSENAFTEYKNKVVETIGEKKEQTIREKIDKDRIDRNPIGKSEVIITDKGNTLCMEYISGRYFKSDIDQLNKAVNNLNRQMLINEYVSLNDFYDEIGLDHTKMGYDLGWRIDKGYVDLSYSSQIADDGKTPCIVVSYSLAPMHDYSKFN